MVGVEEAAGSIPGAQETGLEQRSEGGFREGKRGQGRQKGSSPLLALDRVFEMK
jgi:hypothetical protein